MCLGGWVSGVAGWLGGDGGGWVVVVKLGVGGGG